MSERAETLGVPAAYNTHSLPTSEHSSHANNQRKCCQSSPAPVGMAESDDNCVDNAYEDSSDANDVCKCLTWRIAVADSPSDEVGMCLMAKTAFNSPDNISES
jgi:hypothetical protein